jgi:PPIC-type PPIASE domain
MTTANPLDLPGDAPARPDRIASSSPLYRAARLAERIFRHRLAQFTAIGGLIFAIAPRPSPARQIALHHQQLGALHAAEAAREGRIQISDARIKEIDQRTIEDELLYREGVRLGLDREDGIVRQRIVQKTLFLAEELAGASRPPTDAELRAFFEGHRERFTRPAKIHFIQIFAHERSSLPEPPPGAAAGPLAIGEPAPIAPELDADPDQIAAALGAPFADAVSALRAGEWSGPLQSAFGWHRVHVVDRREGRPAELSEVRSSVVEQFDIFRRQEAVAAFLTRAFTGYRVEIDGQPLRDFTPSRRVAFHAETSGED